MPKLIRDEFSDLKVSRQRRYQMRKRSRGLCIICTEKAADGCRCERHLIINRERQRERLGCRRRFYGAKSYQAV
jgi:hypothetical protein